jgi:hypothetical protein
MAAPRPREAPVTSQVRMTGLLINGNRSDVIMVSPCERVMPAVDEATLPCSLLERFDGSSGQGGAVAALLGVLQPISTRPWLSASAS